MKYAVLPDQAEIDQIVLGRQKSLFVEDMDNLHEQLKKEISRSRVLVVGGAGTIGSATTMLIADLLPKSLHVVDQSENYLAELVRDLRGRQKGLGVSDFKTLPLDYGAPVMGQFLASEKPYDMVLNFAALKHVRSEKDVFSLLQMIDTNVVRHIRFRSWLKKYSHANRYFAVSTDKAANPTSLMGASKRLMEDVAFDPRFSTTANVSTARFANVAFSNGSLLQGFISRLAKKQPLAAPRDTRRYFVSQVESGEICLLSAVLGKSGAVLFPKLDPVTHLQLLEDIASRFLKSCGLQPVLFDDEYQARQAMQDLPGKDQWPLLLTPLDTSGEKPYEEFVGVNEQRIESGFKTLDAVSHIETHALSEGVIAMLEDAVSRSEGSIDKAAIVQAIQPVIPGFAHRETGRSLDERL
jgi:FlaA1/EpsC-like NDP-sugar epimerase